MTGEATAEPAPHENLLDAIRITEAPEAHFEYVDGHYRLAESEVSLVLRVITRPRTNPTTQVTGFSCGEPVCKPGSVIRVRAEASHLQEYENLQERAGIRLALRGIS